MSWILKAYEQLTKGTLVIRCGKRGLKYSTHLEPNNSPLFWRVDLYTILWVKASKRWVMWVLGSCIGIIMSHYKDSLLANQYFMVHAISGFFPSNIAHLGGYLSPATKTPPRWLSPLFAAMYIKGILAANQLMPPIHQGGVGAHDSIHGSERWPQLANLCSAIYIWGYNNSHF